MKKDENNFHGKRHIHDALHVAKTETIDKRREKDYYIKTSSLVN